MISLVTAHRSLVGLLAAAILLAGCSVANPKPPNAAAHPAPTESPQPTVPQVAKPWQPGMPQLGVNVYWEDSKEDDDEVTRRKAERILDYLVSLNVNSVSVNFPFIMDGITASAVKPDPKYTPSAERVKLFLEAAAARKLRTGLRPLLDERRLLPDWRGEIEPADRDAWFASYQAFLTPYLNAAQQTGAAEVVLGVELNSIQGDQRWRSLINAARKSFTGTITYSVNFDAYQSGLATPPVDQVGLDMYFKVRLPDTASVDELAGAWEWWIDEYVGQQASTTVLHEVGIVAQNGAYRHPAQWGSTAAPLNLEVQKNWYAAVCRAVERKELAGVYFWNVRIHHNPGKEDPYQADRMTFVDRPAAATMRDCYARLAG